LGDRMPLATAAHWYGALLLSKDVTMAARRLSQAWSLRRTELGASPETVESGYWYALAQCRKGQRKEAEVILTQTLELLPKAQVEKRLETELLQLKDRMARGPC
jgi:Tetratricopeptide repeat